MHRSVMTCRRERGATRSLREWVCARWSVRPDRGWPLSVRLPVRHEDEVISAGSRARRDRQRRLHRPQHASRIGTGPRRVRRGTSPRHSGSATTSRTCSSQATTCGPGHRARCSPRRRIRVSRRRTPFAMPTMHWYRAEGSHLAEHWGVLDQLVMLAQVGALPRAPEPHVPTHTATLPALPSQAGHERHEGAARNRNHTWLPLAFCWRECGCACRWNRRSECVRDR